MDVFRQKVYKEFNHNKITNSKHILYFLQINPKQSNFQNKIYREIH